MLSGMCMSPDGWKHLKKNKKKTRRCTHKAKRGGRFPSAVHIQIEGGWILTWGRKHTHTHTHTHTVRMQACHFNSANLLKLASDGGMRMTVFTPKSSAAAVYKQTSEGWGKWQCCVTVNQGQRKKSALEKKEEKNRLLQLIVWIDWSLWKCCTARGNFSAASPPTPCWFIKWTSNLLNERINHILTAIWLKIGAAWQPEDLTPRCTEGAQAIYAWIRYSLSLSLSGILRHWVKAAAEREAW